MAGKVVNLLRGKGIGTVKGDIHGLGKNIAGALLTAYGFEVLGLGVDVPVDKFVKHCQEFQPDIIGLSVLFTSCYPYLGETITALRAEWSDGEYPPIFISGAQITPQHQNFTTPTIRWKPPSAPSGCAKSWSAKVLSRGAMTAGRR